MTSINPLVIDIEKSTINNPYYRRVIYTDANIQVVLMTLLPGEDIPMEVHSGTQFIRIEKGNAKVQLNRNVYELSDNDAVTVPPGTHHYVKNIGDGKLSFYSIYSPPEHSPDHIDRRQPRRR